VGFMCTCSAAGGYGAEILPGEDVFKAWVGTVNAAGGINGHLLHVTYEDDAGNPGTSVSDIQTLISDHAVAIVDDSILDMAWASTIEAAHIPVVGISLTNIPFYTNPDFYPEGQTNDSTNIALVTTLKTAGASNYADFYCAESPICAESVPQLRSDGKQLGVPLVLANEISATAPNYTAQCVAAKQANVTGVFIGASSVEIARIGSDCARQGFQPIYVTGGEGFGMVESNAPGMKDHLWNEYNDLPFWADSPATQAMKTAVDKGYPGLMENANLFNELSAMAWPSGILLEDAIKAGNLTASDSPSAAEVLKGLGSLKGDTLEGWSPPLTFPAGQPHPIDCWYTARVQNGVPSLADSGKVSCSKGSSS
jgi:branched-chain amino acid transport system substrate-binding protein